MTKGEKIFNIIVTAAVLFTGGGFGAYTGLAYGSGFVYPEVSFAWIGMVAGLVSSYPLAKLYLRKIKKARTEDGRKAMVWLFGTFLAGLCGIICSVVVHVVMMMLTYYSDLSVWLIALIVGILVGGIAGTAVGAICSLVYVLAIKRD